MVTDVRVSFLGHEMKNPVVPASGTFGFGWEFAEYYDINVLGSMSLKGTTAEARYGQSSPEDSGMHGGAHQRHRAPKSRGARCHRRGDTPS